MRKYVVGLIVLVFLSGALSLYVYANKNDKPVPTLKDAMALARQGKPAEAVEIIKQIINLGPDNTQNHLSLGLVYFNSSQYDNALTEFTKTTDMNKNSPMAYYFMGLIFEKKALVETGAANAKDYKKKAIVAWQNYIGCDRSAIKIPEGHKNIGISLKESIRRAKRHIEVLQEDLRND
jgi:tetratricopeptide (TPR) repeat protein